MRIYSILILAFLLLPQAWAQPISGCTNCGPDNDPPLINFENEEAAIVNAVNSKVKDCYIFKYMKIKDISDVYSVFSINYNLQKKVGVQPDTSTCETCKKIEKSESCKILTDEIAKDLFQFLRSKDAAKYLQQSYPETILDPKIFIADFLKLMKDTGAEVD